MKTLLILLLLFTPAAFAAQKAITIPAGKNIYGPINASILDKRTKISLIRTDGNFTLLTIDLQYSTDGVNFITFCTMTHNGGLPAVQKVSLNCPLPPGVQATEVRAIATATGGSVTIQAIPTVAAE